MSITLALYIVLLSAFLLQLRDDAFALREFWLARRRRLWMEQVEKLERIYRGNVEAVEDDE